MNHVVRVVDYERYPPLKAFMQVPARAVRGTPASTGRRRGSSDSVSSPTSPRGRRGSSQVMTPGAPGSPDVLPGPP